VSAAAAAAAAAAEAAATQFFVIRICDYSYMVANFQINLFMIYTM